MVLSPGLRSITEAVILMVQLPSPSEAEAEAGNLQITIRNNSSSGLLLGRKSRARA